MQKEHRVRQRKEFGHRYHFEGDGCDPGKCPEDHVLPALLRPTKAAELERVGDRAMKRRLFRGSDV